MYTLNNRMDSKANVIQSYLIALKPYSSLCATFTVVIHYLPAVASLAPGSMLQVMKPARTKRYKRFVSLKPTEILSHPTHR